MNAEADNKKKPCKCKRWKKFLIILLLSLIPLYFVLTYALGSIIKSSVTTLGPAILGTPISIENVHTRIFNGYVNIDGLVVGPPEGFDANLFELKNFRIKLDTGSLFGSAPIVINEINISDPIVSYELKGLNDNLHAVLKKLQPAEEEAAKEEEKPEEDKKAGRKVVIERFNFEGGRVRVAVANGKGAVIPLPTIELKDIGKKSGGATGIEAFYEILKSITVGTVKAAAGVVADLGGAVIDAGAAVGGAVIDAGGKAVGAVGDAASAVGGAITGAIGGLFGGDDDKAEAKAEKTKEAK